MKQFSLDLVHATEEAAIAASTWLGSGDKLAADKDAVKRMRDRLNNVEFCGRVIICEGEKDKSYMFARHEKLGLDREGTIYDLAIDPIDGTRATVEAQPEALSVIGCTTKDSFHYISDYYVNKLVYGPKIAKRARLYVHEPIDITLKKVALATNKSFEQITVCMLNRERHNDYIKEIRKLGVRIKLIQDGDISGAIAACLPDTGIDILYGVGGGPEAIISACAVKCLGGQQQIQLVKGKNKDVFNLDDLVKDDCIFCATGITDGMLLEGVKWFNNRLATHTVYMRSESKTVRYIKTIHGN